ALGRAGRELASARKASRLAVELAFSRWGGDANRYYSIGEVISEDDLGLARSSIATRTLEIRLYIWTALLEGLGRAGRMNSSVARLLIDEIEQMTNRCVDPASRVYRIGSLVALARLTDGDLRERYA